MLRFLLENRRWLATGFLLAFGSAFGQTWFISLFAGEIRAKYGLSDGDWGAIYTIATLGSALLLLARGSLADTVPISRLAPVIAGLFAVAAAMMAFGTSVWLLGIAIFLLRFCGQGMFTHMKVTAMARWFVATRGRAIAVTNLGYPMAEVLLPLPVLLLIGFIGWRAAWGGVALVISLVVMPLLIWLLAENRAPRESDGQSGSRGLEQRHWTRAQVLRHWGFLATIPLMLTPGFIGTVAFFQQSHVAEVMGWSLTAMAPAYPAYAIATISFALITGWACDRFGPAKLLPIVALPMGIGAILMGTMDSPGGWILALGLMGITQGISGTVWGTFLPWAYGTDHLGAVRAVVTALMVLSTAIGPGLTGLLIDAGIPFPAQGPAMGLWCLLLCIGMGVVSAQLLRRS